MAIKVPAIYATVIEIVCPYCDDGMECPATGSLGWDITTTPFGKSVRCSSCGQLVKLPTMPKKVNALGY